MKTNKILQTMGFGLVISALAAYQAGAIVAYNTPTSPAPGGIQTGGPFILGNEFTVNSSINITAVGAFDYQQDGFSGAGVAVAIYQLVAGNWNELSGTAHTFTGTPGAGTYVGGNTFYGLSSPVSLGAGTYAVVAANYGTPGNQNWNRNLVLGAPADQGTTFQTTSGAISMAGGNYSFYASGSTLGGTLSGLTFGNWGTPQPSFGAGTFEFTAVPEVETFAVAGAGMLGLVFIGRKVATRRV